MRPLVRVIAAIHGRLLTRLLPESPNGEEVRRPTLVRLAVERPYLTASVAAMGAITVAALVLISGVVPLGASSGHWRITAALLDFAKIRSVSTHSWAVEVPPLDDEALVLRGAGHYESVCVTCHGGPGRRMPPVMTAMTPAPPELSERLSRWAPEELFSIVKHGIKFTGMPAWPTQQRDDEVWAMVAFLRRLPQLDATGYRRLVHGDTSLPPQGTANAVPSTEAPASPSDPLPQAPPPAVRNVCERCHGPNGTGRGSGAFPSLAGQHAEYLYASLRAFADRSRFSGTMSSVAADLSDDDMHTTAAYYAGLMPRARERSDEPSAIARGTVIASRGVPERDIPACVECHGPTGRPKNAMYPRLVGQHPSYLAEQLRLLQERRRGGSPNITLMHVFVDRLRSDEIRDVTLYYGAMP